MVRLTRASEYGIIALRYLSEKGTDEPDRKISAREIAAEFGLPFEITAKILLKLKSLEFVDSVHGAKGGYFLRRALREIRLTEFLDGMEGPQGVVPCERGVEEGHTCEYQGKCEVRSGFGKLNRKVQDFLGSIFLSEFIE